MAPLINTQGVPEAPRDILRRLREHHPALSLRLSGGGKWAVTWEWPEQDPRWARVRSNEISKESAFDIIGYLPVDCSLMDAAGYVENAFKNYPKEEVRKMAASMRHWNEVEVPKQQTEQVISDSLDDMARIGKTPTNRKRIEVVSK